MVEPSTIEPIACLVASATSPFLKWFSDGPSSVGGIVNLMSVIRIVLIVLVLLGKRAGSAGGVESAVWSWCERLSSGGTCVGEESPEGTRTSSG